MEISVIQKPSRRHSSVMDETSLRDSLTELHAASFGWALVCCRQDRELAADVLQSVYLSVLEGRATFAGRSAFKTWLFGVIRNVARDQKRGRWWSRVVRLDWQSLSSLAEHHSASENLDEDLQAVRSALNQLPQRQQALIHLVFYEQLTVGEAANLMKITVGSARQHYARAKRTLRQQLQHLHGNEPAKAKTNARLI